MTTAPRSDASNLFATPKTTAEHRVDGSIVLRSSEPLREVDDVLGHDEVRTAIAQGLAKLKQQGANSSGHATRALLLVEPPSVDGGEITDKGYINQRTVLTRRADAVKRLNDDGSAEWIGL